MRTLFVLRGAPGAGKSTLIRRHGLGDLITPSMSVTSDEEAGE